MTGLALGRHRPAERAGAPADGHEPARSRFVRQSCPMDPRHGDRAPQVRRRPPPSSAKRRVKARPVEPSPTRLSRYRRVERRRGLPFLAKALVVSAIALVIAVAIGWS